MKKTTTTLLFLCSWAFYKFFWNRLCYKKCYGYISNIQYPICIKFTVWKSQLWNDDFSYEYGLYYSSDSDFEKRLFTNPVSTDSRQFSLQFFYRFGNVGSFLVFTGNACYQNLQPSHRMHHSCLWNKHWSCPWRYYGSGRRYRKGNLPG